MTDEARTRDGVPVHVADYGPAQWEALKLSSRLGDFVMTCCQAPAVLKTSINGVRFFSHLSDECATAPETIWHQAGKEAVLGALRSLGMEGHDEVPGKAPDGRKWTADMLFTTGGRTVAIELQRSPQTLREFLSRQARYKASGVECYWLLRQENFITLHKASLRESWTRLGKPREPFGMGLLPELPTSILKTSESPAQVFGGYPFTVTVTEWLTAIAQGRFVHRDWTWVIDNEGAE